MAKSSGRSTRRPKPRKKASVEKAVPHVDPTEQARILTIALLERLLHLINTDNIHSFDTWADDLAGDLGLPKPVVKGMIEPQALITIGAYFCVTGLFVGDLKKIFEAVVGTASEPTRTMAKKIVTDTITRLQKKS